MNDIERAFERAHEGDQIPADEASILMRGIRKEMLATHLLQEFGVTVQPGDTRSSEQRGIALGYLHPGDLDYMLSMQDQSARQHRETEQGIGELMAEPSSLSMHGLMAIIEERSTYQSDVPVAD